MASSTIGWTPVNSMLVIQAFALRVELEQLIAHGGSCDGLEVEALRLLMLDRSRISGYEE